MAAALQFIIEEKYLAKYRVPALLGVGLEGMWGLLLSAIALPILSIVKGSDGMAVDSLVTAFKEIANSWQLQVRPVCMHESCYKSCLQDDCPLPRCNCPDTAGKLVLYHELHRKVHRRECFLALFPRRRLWCSCFTYSRRTSMNQHSACFYMKLNIQLGFIQGIQVTILCSCLSDRRPQWVAL